MAFLKKFAKVLAGGITFFLLLIAVLLAVWYQEDFTKAENEEKYLTTHSQYLRVKDADLHLKKMGSGHPIFLIHGSFASLHTWEVWEKYLSKNYQTISMDLPGHGLSGPNESNIYTTAYYADLLWELADQLGIDSLAIAGNSMGGKVAYEMALKRPKRVTHLILVDAAGATSSTVEKDSSTTAKRKSFSVFTLLNNPIISKLMIKVTPKFLFEGSLKQVYYDQSKIVDATITRYYELLLQTGNRQATMQRFKQRSPNKFADLKNLAVPSLILWGKHDAWIPVSDAARFAAILPNNKLMIYEDAGHVPMEEIPEKSVQDVLNFLQKYAENTP